MNRYIFLTPGEIIRTGDEYRATEIDNWRRCNGWVGKRVESLLALLGGRGQMRRKSNKKVKRKPCVNWT